MEHRKIGESGLTLSAITFGAWAIGGVMWGGSDRKAAIEAIQTAVDNGVTSFDTAPMYGYGLSEELLATALTGMSRDRVQLLTKCGLRWEGTKGDYFFTLQDQGRAIPIYRYAGKESIIEECEQSLKRLRTDYIDLYQVHWPDVTTPIEETIDGLTRLQEAGKIRAAGVCNFSETDLIAAANQGLPIASNQVPFSMVERTIESALIPFCQQAGKAVLAYSPLQCGLLTGKLSPDHPFTDDDHRQQRSYCLPENIRRVNAFLDQIKPLAQSKGATLSQLVIRWTLDRPGITVAIVGARNARQAGENAEAASLILTGDETAWIDQQLAGLVLVTGDLDLY